MLDGALRADDQHSAAPSIRSAGDGQVSLGGQRGPFSGGGLQCDRHTALLVLERETPGWISASYLVHWEVLRLLKEKESGCMTQRNQPRVEPRTFQFSRASPEERQASHLRRPTSRSSLAREPPPAGAGRH